MGADCLNDLSMEELRLLEEEMDKSVKTIRERKVRYILDSYALFENFIKHTTNL
jgi:MADS-box transcription factor